MRAQCRGRPVSWVVAVTLFGLSLAVYVARMAPSVVPGDPGEYQLVAARWGIGHPPGYGFYALLGNLFTHLLPIGTFAWRANLLSAVCGAAIVALAYGIGRTLVSANGRRASSFEGQFPAILGALALACGLDLWEHALHANAHVVTALLATTSLFCLSRWWYLDRVVHPGRDRWLFLFCLVAGLSPVQHPLLAFAFPAYGLFVLAVRPNILRQPRTMLRMVGGALLGLTAYLYYPVRSALGAPPAPGPDNMQTWAGFVGVVTAKGLRVNLGGFSAGDVMRRLWDVRVPLGLQYAPPMLALAVLGLIGLWRRHWRPALLLTGYAACIVVVTVNVLQDAMAYLLGPIVALGVLVGLGGDLLLTGVHRWTRQRWVVPVLAASLSISPLWMGTANWQRMDLSDYRDADDWLAGVEGRFLGRGEGAALLTEWERMTTIYYYAAVEGRTWDAADLRFVPIWAGDQAPFLEAAEANLSQGPAYLTSYRPEVASKYRLMPSGKLWQVLPSWPRELPDEASPTDVRAQGLFEIVGWQVNQDRVHPGDVLLLDLYMRIPDSQAGGTDLYYLPWARLGETTYHFTTDSRFLTPWWQPGEIVVERYELPVPWRAEVGSYPLEVGVRLVNEGRDLELANGELTSKLTDIAVGQALWRPAQRKLEGALGNLHGEILLRQARLGRCVVLGGRRLGTADGDPRVTIRPGRRLIVVLEWESLRPIEENYKVFVQLLDADFQIRAQGDDKAPLGGSAPTLLWFPRWRRGTQIADTYVLQVPADLPPGQYPLVVGMYGFTTFKRVQVVSPDGDMAGDWITLAHLWVE